MPEPRIFFDKGTLIQGTRVIRECERHVFVTRRGEEISLRQYELECLCGNTIKRKVGALVQALQNNTHVCCLECRKILREKPAPAKKRGRKPFTFKQGEVVAGATVVRQGPTNARKIRRYDLRCACGKVIRRSVYRVKEAIRNETLISCYKCRGRRAHRQHSELLDSTHFEPGEVIGGAKVLREEIRTKDSRPYRLYVLECKCGVSIWRSIGHLLRSLKKETPVACFSCRNPEFVRPKSNFKLGDTVGGAKVLRECGCREYKKGPHNEFELRCPCGRLIHRTESRLERCIKEGSILRCKACVISKITVHRRRARQKFKNERIRESLVDKYYRYGTIWSPTTLQRITEDIAEALEIELDEGVPHPDFFILYDGEPAVASPFWPHSDDDSDE